MGRARHNVFSMVLGLVDSPQFRAFWGVGVLTGFRVMCAKSVLQLQFSPCVWVCVCVCVCVSMLLVLKGGRF